MAKAEASIKRAHHVVPQFYLKRFANGSKEIFQTDKVSGLAQLTPVKHATVVRDLYTLDGNDGQEVDTFENMYSKIESGAARAFTAIDQGVWPLTAPQRESMAFWIIAQSLRTPRMRNDLDDSMKEHRKKIGSLSLDQVRVQAGNPPWPDAVLAAKWQETLDYYKVDGPQPRNAQARWFRHLVSEPTRALFYRSWTFAHFDGSVLLTSDTPVLPLHKDGLPTEIKNPAAADLVVVPLGRTTMLLIQPTLVSREPDMIVGKSRDFATVINLLMAAHADRFLFEHPEDKIHGNLPVLADD
jgi:hypothetical protein